MDFSKLNPFNNHKVGPEVITINGTIAIDGYVPNPVAGKMYVCEVDNFTVIRSSNAKDRRGVKKLIGTATISDADIVKMYGDHVIIVDKAFKKLSATQKLVLIDMENEKNNANISKYVSNFGKGVSADDLAENTAIRLNVIEKFGYRKTAKAISAKIVFEAPSEKRVGNYLYSEQKKALKSAKNPSIVDDLVSIINDMSETDKVVSDFIADDEEDVATDTAEIAKAAKETEAKAEKVGADGAKVTRSHHKPTNSPAKKAPTSPKAVVKTVVVKAADTPDATLAVPAT